MPDDEVRERLGSLPARFRQQKLWFQLLQLRELIDAGVMDCRFEAATDL